LLVGGLDGAGGGEVARIESAKAVASCEIIV
jgi:hypothetical protein